MLPKTLLLLVALASLMIANSGKAQDLTPNQRRLTWDGWDIKVNELYFTTSIKERNTTADDDSVFVFLHFSVTNGNHEGETFIPQNEMKIVLGSNSFDASDIDPDCTFIKNIEPTLTRDRRCYFELPKALIKDSFVIRLSRFLETDADIMVSVSTPDPTPIPTLVAVVGC